MLLCFPAKQRALNVPVYFLGISAMALVGTWLALGQSLGGAALSGVFALGFLAFSLSYLRGIFVDGDDLVVRSVYGTKRVPRDAFVITSGIQRSSQGGATYLLYASYRDQKITLCESWFKRFADGQKRALTETFLVGRLPTAALRDNEEHLENAAVEKQKRRELAAKFVEERYGKGSDGRLVMIISVSLLLVILGGTLAMTLLMR